MRNGNDDTSDEYFRRLPLPGPNIQLLAQLAYQYWQLSSTYDACTSSDDGMDASAGNDNGIGNNEMVRYALYKIAVYDHDGLHHEARPPWPCDLNCSADGNIHGFVRRLLRRAYGSMHRNAMVDGDILAIDRLSYGAFTGHLISQYMINGVRQCVA